MPPDLVEIEEACDSGFVGMKDLLRTYLDVRTDRVSCSGHPNPRRENDQD